MDFIFSPHAPRPIGPYSQATLANGFVFCSGQVGADPQGNISPDIVEQTRQALTNLFPVFSEAGCHITDVVKTTLFLVRAEDFAEVNKVYAEFFGDHRPARSTVVVQELPRGSLDHAPLIEIEMIAYLRR